MIRRHATLLCFLLACGLAAGGGATVWRAGQRIPVTEAQIEGLAVHLQEARWIVDQMDHGENFAKPSVMMPDMPEWGRQRVTLDLSVANRGRRPRVFDGGEMALVAGPGREIPPVGAQVGLATLAPGQTLNTTLHFDLDTSEPHGRLLVEWARGGEAAYFAVPEPPEHYHLRPRGGVDALPPEARFLVPLGDGERGEKVYARAGCVACHGDPRVADSNLIGPHLGEIGRSAASRIEGTPAEQYIYQSILDPDAFLAPECRGGAPCAAPSAMPQYASLMTPGEMADLLVYLIGLGG